MEAVPGRARPNVPGGTAPPPPAVDSAAAARGLGAFVDVRREGVVIRMVVGGIFLVLLGLLFGSVFAVMGRSSPGRLGIIRPTAMVGTVLSFIMIGGGLAVVVRGILGGWRGHYQFVGGMVHRFFTGTRVVTWAEIDRFTPIYNRYGDGADGRILGYRVEAGGRKVAAVPILLVDGRDSFIDQVHARLGGDDRPDEAAATSESASAPPSAPSGSLPSAPVTTAPYQEGTAEQREIMRAKAERGVMFGVLWIVFGLLLTAISYSMTSAYSGGTYFIYWGAAVYGIYRLVRSLIQLNRMKADGDEPAARRDDGTTAGKVDG